MRQFTVACESINQTGRRTYLLLRPWAALLHISHVPGNGVPLTAGAYQEADWNPHPFMGKKFAIAHIKLKPKWN